MDRLPQITMGDYWYDLPDHQIARYPLPQRDRSRLLVWDNGEVLHRHFFQISDFLTSNDVVFFNNTKVIPARLHFRKSTGALIEVFLLSPLDPPVVDMAMQQTSQCDWACTIGNLKSWKNGVLLEQPLLVNGNKSIFRARLLDAAKMHVRFEWDGKHSLVAMLEAMGNVPIPPYLQRSADESDRTNYQTVYGKKEGAVAAPTAGLHFTSELIDGFRAKGIALEELTLHVSAGTFKPVKVENAIDHDMHFEQVVVKRRNLEALLDGRRVVCVGTTALRTLESIYWFGARLLEDPEAYFLVKKTDPYTLPMPPVSVAIQTVLKYMDEHGLNEINGTTQLFIMPGYTFKICKTLITNFHQPGSTLLLLVAALLGEDKWRPLYDTALSEGYRFLSYGDGSFLCRDR